MGIQDYLDHIHGADTVFQLSQKGTEAALRKRMERHAASRSSLAGSKTGRPHTSHNPPDEQAEPPEAGRLSKAPPSSRKRAGSEATSGCAAQLMDQGLPSASLSRSMPAGALGPGNGKQRMSQEHLLSSSSSSDESLEQQLTRKLRGRRAQILYDTDGDDDDDDDGLKYCRSDDMLSQQARQDKGVMTESLHDTAGLSSEPTSFKQTGFSGWLAKMGNALSKPRPVIPEPSPHVHDLLAAQLSPPGTSAATSTSAVLLQATAALNDPVSPLADPSFARESFREGCFLISSTTDLAGGMQPRLSAADPCPTRSCWLQSRCPQPKGPAL